MNAQDLTKALGGRWGGHDGTARCPAHEDKTPSLSVRDGDDDTLLTHCFAGCPPEAVWGALQDRGLVERGGDRRPTPRRPRPPRRPASLEPSPNQDHALELWRASQPATGTPAEGYLRGRGTNRTAGCYAASSKDPSCECKVPTSSRAAGGIARSTANTTSSKLKKVSCCGSTTTAPAAAGTSTAASNRNRGQVFSLVIHMHKVISRQPVRRMTNEKT